MPFGRMLDTSFTDARLLPLVLSDNEFARHGYRWGFDGTVYYCFLNPDKVRFEIFKKNFYWRWLLTLLIPAVNLISWFTILILPKHFTKTAKAQPAAVVSNGPQMRFPFNMQPVTVSALVSVAFVAPVFLLMIFGAKLLGIGSVASTLIGVLLGANLLALTLWLIGVFSTPYGNVITPSPSSSESAPAVAGTYHFGRGGATNFGSYSIGPLQPTGLTWASGGLTPIVTNGSPASVLPGFMGANYTSLMNRSTTLVVWGLVTWNLVTDPIIAEAIDSQRLNYGPTLPVGLILVAAAKEWGNAETMSMILHHTVDAVATDGSTSALLGSSGELKIETYMFKDVTQRYGFMCIPE